MVSRALADMGATARMAAGRKLGHQKWKQTKFDGKVVMEHEEKYLIQYVILEINRKNSPGPLRIPRQYLQQQTRSSLRPTSSAEKHGLPKAV